MKGGLYISIGSLFVEFTRFIGRDLPRTDPTTNDVQYNASGTTIITSTFYEPPKLWNVRAVCNQEEYELLTCIWAEHLRRKINRDASDILIVDRTQLFTENTPRTRAIAPSTSEILRPTGTPTHVLYYAQFAGAMPVEPRYQEANAIEWIVEFQLQETRKLPA